MSDPKQGEDFASLFAAYEREQAAKQGGQPGKGAGRGPQVGDKVTGTNAGFGEESAFVDLGGKAEGVIPLAELRDADGKLTAEVGEALEAMVVGTEADGGGLLLRRRPGQGPTTPAEVLQAHEHGFPVEGVVQGVVKGGVEVTVSGLRAFCPVSQLDNSFVEDPAVFVGRRLQFRISRLEEGRGGGKAPNLVLSRRVLLEEEARARAEEARAKLQPGKLVRGTVTSLASYGAFVDLGGVEGLLHVSELGHGRVAHPQDVLTVGQEVEVEVKKLEKDAKGRDRISLSRKSLVQDPWEAEAARLLVGTRRTGRVARLEAFGAFVELAPGVDGLLHVSELGAGRALRHPREAVRPGDTIEVAIQAVDRERRRISLVLAGKAPEMDPDAVAPEEPPGFGALGDFLAKAQKKKQ
jgi:small subunit ribosomal protein S1